MSDKTVSGNKTLFVRNLPYTVSKETLEEHFSEYGPLKNCFIVGDKGKSRGFGYVQFTIRDDAIKAKDAKNFLEGRKLTVDYADIKHKKKNERKPKKKEESDDVNGEEGTDDEDPVELDTELAGTVKQIKQEPDIKNVKKDKYSQLKYHNAKIVLLTGLPAAVTDTELQKCLQHLNVKCVAETKIIGSGKVHVKFKCIRDAKKAVRRLNNQAYKDTLLQADQLTKDSETVPQSAVKRSRVIVRNLAFRCTDTDLQNAFLKYGTVTEVKLPTNNDGKSLGFGFVQFSSVQEAQKAITGMNLQKIAGRPVAVDWAIPKDRYEKKQAEQVKDEDDSDTYEDDVKVKVKEEPESDDDEGEDDEEEEESGGDSEEESASNIDEAEEDDDDDDNDEEEDDDDDDEEENSDESDDSTEINKKSKMSLKNKVQKKSDVDDGCTIFIRNLSFDATEDSVMEFFEQYGKLVYARIVVDPNTEHSRGMAFVKFAEKSSADACIAASLSQSLSLDGRDLILSLAVSREQSSKFNDKKEKVKKDNRNLHLAREGLIRPGTAAAEGLSKSDLDHRAKVTETKRQKLKNIDIFISPLRLCVRNLPTNVDEKKLRTIFKSAAKQSAAKVTECRIMRDRAKVNSEGVAKSQGYGFVSFSEHQHALESLRHLNNNPDIFGKDKRLIVEFSLENRKALDVQAKRKERFLAKRNQLKQQIASSGEEQVGNIRHEGKKGNNRQGKQAAHNPKLYMSEKDRQLKGGKLPKGLPSHWGPKVRHKARQTQPAGKSNHSNQVAGKTKGPQQFVKQPMKRPLQHAEGPANKKSRRGNKTDSDNFDKLVSNYRSKFMGKRTDKKWFSS